MKKTPARKLTLDRESLRRLDVVQLEVTAGAWSGLTTICKSVVEHNCGSMACDYSVSCKSVIC